MNQSTRPGNESETQQSRIKQTVAAGLLLASAGLAINSENTSTSDIVPATAEAGQPFEYKEPSLDQPEFSIDIEPVHEVENTITYRRPSVELSNDTKIVEINNLDSATTTTTTSSTSTTTTSTTTSLPEAIEESPTVNQPENPEQEKEPVVETPKPETIDIVIPPVMPTYEAPLPPFTMPEAEPMTAEMRELLKKNTAYIPSLGCSGYIVRDEEDKPIGAITAEHCHLLADSKPRKTNDQQERYIETFGPLNVYTGDGVRSLNEAGEVGSIIVPPENDTSEDFALLVFKGEDPKAVYEAMSPAPKLSKGDTVHFSGWPVDQDNNPGSMIRQEFTLQYLGEGNSYTTLDENLEGVQFFAMKSNEFGAECSFGASGSVAIDKDGNIIGTLAVFDEFVPDTWQKSSQAADAVRKWYESVFNVDLEGYTNMCGFIPAPGFENMEIFKVVENDTGIIIINPGGGKGGETTTTTTTTIVEQDPVVVEQEAFRNQAFEDVFNPEIQKTFVDGWIMNPAVKGGETTKPYIENPMIIMDSTGGAMMYWRDDSMADGFGYAHFNDAATIDKNVTFLRIATDIPETALESVDGEVSKFYGGFMDGDSQHFGTMIVELPTFRGEIVRWSMKYVEGKWIFARVENVEATTTTTTTTVPEQQTTTTTIPTSQDTTTTQPKEELAPTTTVGSQ